jgi:hypothetical protein
VSIIKTPAPIDIADLKKFFIDKETFFEIDYAASTIREEKLLVYISNLDLPCDITVDNDDDALELVRCYLESNFLVSLPSLEALVISLLLQHKGIEEVKNQDMLTALSLQLDSWVQKLDSLPLFNMYCINDEELQEWVKSEHKENDTAELTGVNFVSLLKYEDFYQFYEKIDSTPTYYSKYFNEYMFKGSNLFSYWANENNPMFLLTSAIAEGQIDTENYIKCVEQETN